MQIINVQGEEARSIPAIGAVPVPPLSGCKIENEWLPIISTATNPDNNMEFKKKIAINTKRNVPVDSKRNIREKSFFPNIEYIFEISGYF